MVKIKPRYTIPGMSEYVVQDPKTKAIEYRVPPVCITWPQDFRMRLVRDLVNDVTMSAIQADNYISYMTYTPFLLRRVAVSFIVKTKDSGLRNARVLVKTYLHSEGRDEAIELYHSNPAVRSLMVYAYLTGERIGGMPRLRPSKDFR